MPTENISLYLPIMVVYLMGLVSPGPDFALVLRNALWSPRWGALHTAGGIACGVLIHILIVALMVGLGGALSQDLLKILGFLGGLYLLFLGSQTLFVEKNRKEPYEQVKSVSKANSTATGRSRLSFFRQGLLTNLLNAKAAAFFWSILLTLAEAARERQFIFGLVAVYMVVTTFLWFWWIGSLLGYPAVQSRLFRIRRPINVIMGLLLIAYSAFLLLNVLD